MTWEDLERLSRTDAYIHQALHVHWHSTTYTREQMLIDLVCTLSRARAELHKQNVELISERPKR